jgi:HEAT repeat protein
MKLRIVTVLVVLLALSAGMAWSAQAAGSPNLVDQALTKVGKLDQNANGFSFIVVGDTQGSEKYTPPETFHQIVREANALGVACVVVCGDLLSYGYAYEQQTRRMWDVVIADVKTSQPAFFPVVGNHDVTTELHERLWREYAGPTWYSFDYGGCHFIALDSEQVGFRGEISDAQFEWLRADLAKTKARHIFVFLHEPLFDASAYPGIWDRVHDLLRRHPGTAVFSGHWHLYRKLPEKEGVRYYIVGGGGGGIMDNPRAGDFHHYMLVSVRVGEVRQAVVRPGSVLPEDILTNGTAEEQVHVVNRLDYKQAPRLAERLLSSFSGVDQSSVVGALKSLAASGEPNARSVALAAVSLVRKPEAVPALRDLLQSPDGDLQVAAAEALAGIGGDQGREAVRELLNSERPRLRQTAASSMTKLGQAQDVERLWALVSDKDEKTRVWAVRAIGALGGQRDIPGLQALLDDEEVELRVAAVNAIGTIGGPAALETLRRLLRSDDPEMRREAIYEIAGMVEPQDVAPLEEVLKTGDWLVNGAAVHAIAKLGRIEPLQRLLSHDDEGVRSIAAGAIGNMGGLGAVEALTPVMSDPSPRVRRAAQQALDMAGGFHPKGSELVTVVPLVWRAMTDPDKRGLAEGWHKDSFDDSSWGTVRTTTLWFSQSGPMKGISNSQAWARVRFAVDPKWRGRRIMLRIGALDEEGTIYLNGEEIGGRGRTPGGWKLPFEIEVTGKLRYGEPNLLAVRVSCPTELSGMCRPVSLYTAQEH